MKFEIVFAAVAFCVALWAAFGNHSNCAAERSLLAEIKEWLETSTYNVEYPRRIDAVIAKDPQ